MTTCNLCGKIIGTSRGCDCQFVYYLPNNLKMKRLKVGDPGDLYSDRFEDESVICDDCGAWKGEFHHEGCDCEICPKCGGQMISCDCRAFYKIATHRNRRTRKEGE